MKLYLVRHGESISNIKGIIQSPEGKLSEKGKEQAKSLALRFKDIPVDIIVSSSTKRAKETTKIIQRLIGNEVVYTDLLSERKNPSEFIGKHYKDPEFIKLSESMRDSTDPSLHYSDEENFFDLRDRAKRFLEFISNRKEERILCITHSVFLKVIIAEMGFGEQLTPQTIFSLQNFLRIKNTGITVCEKDKEMGWTMHTWNDHVHLGEL